MAKHEIITVNRKILFSHGLNISATLRATVPSLDYRPKQIFFKIHLEQSRCSGFTMVFFQLRGFSKAICWLGMCRFIQACLKNYPVCK